MHLNTNANTIYTHLYTQKPPCLDKTLSSMQAYKNQGEGEMGRSTRKEDGAGWSNSSSSGKKEILAQFKIVVCSTLRRDTILFSG